MQLYTGTKQLKAKSMTRGEYNHYRQWQIPADENPEDAGYLVEYVDGGKSNHPDHEGYISWSPADVFEKAYIPVEGIEEWLYPYQINLAVELAEMKDRMVKLTLFTMSDAFKVLPQEDQDELVKQRRLMTELKALLETRWNRVTAK